MRTNIRLLCLLFSIVCMCACQQSGHYEGMRTPEERQLYRSLNDSMQHKTPHALQLIHEQMEVAEDSLTYYDYYLLYGRHYLIDIYIDSLAPYAINTMRYVNALEEQTPRTRGLWAMAISTFASYMHLLHHNADSVVNFYRMAYEAMMQSDIKECLPDLSANLGDAYLAKNDLLNSSKWYRRALFLTDSLGLPRQQTLTFYMGLGRIYTMLRDFQQAEYYYEMTDRRIDELKPNMKSYFLNNYGNFFYFRQDYDGALATFRRLKRHIESYHSEQNFDMYLCKINMADVFLNLHETDSASYYVSEPEAYFRQNDVGIGIYYAHTIRIGIALEKKDYQEVKRILQEEDKLGLHIDDIDMKSIRDRYMNLYYAAVGDYRKAYAGLQSSMLADDSIRHNRRNLRSTDIMMRLTEDTIRLHNQLRINEQRISYDRTRDKLVVTIGVLIILILLFVLYFNYQRKRYLQTRMNMLTLRLQNTRQRVSPHFVFNVLNTHISKAEKKESEQLIMLSHLIRTNLDLTRRTFVTVREELDFIKEYVDIERKISGMDFDFSIDAPDLDKVGDVRLPSMLIQILTENAILHGLKNKEDGERRLCIQVEDLGHSVRFTVSDNGHGFDIRTYSSERARTGLNIIRMTVSTVNQENKKTKMRFDIKNDNGCHAILTIAKDIQYPTLTETK